jgi:hypothetical protein
MTAKDYYKSTRMVETRNWTLEMAINFAEEYAEALRKHAVSGSLQDRLFELANDFALAKQGNVAVKLHSIHNELQ